MIIELEPVGTVRGGRAEVVDDDWGPVKARIELDPARFGPESLAGLEDFSHLVVVYHFHLADPAKVELLARPVDRGLGLGVEPHGAVEDRLLVVAAQDELVAARDVDAGHRVRAIPDHVAETEHALDPVLLDVLHHRGEGFEVAVDVGNDGVHLGRCRRGPAVESRR